MVVTHSASHCTFHTGLHLASHCISHHTPCHINHILHHSTQHHIWCLNYISHVAYYITFHITHHITPPHIAHRCCIPLHVMWLWCIIMWLWCAVLCIVAKIGAWCVMVWYETCDVECVGTVCMMWDVHFSPPHHTTTYCTPLLHTLHVMQPWCIIMWLWCAICDALWQWLVHDV